MRNQGCGDLLFEKTKRFTGSLKAYKMLSLTIKLVFELGVVLGADRDGRWRNEWQSMIKN